MVKIWCSHCQRPEFVSCSENQIIYLLVVILRQLRVTMILKAVPAVFQISAGSPMVDKCQQSFQTKTRRRTWPPTFKEIGQGNPMNNSGALSDIAPEGEKTAQKALAGLRSAGHRVTGSWNHSRALTTKYSYSISNSPTMLAIRLTTEQL